MEPKQTIKLSVKKKTPTDITSTPVKEKQKTEVASVKKPPEPPINNQNPITIPGIYKLGNNKLLCITDVDPQKKFCYDGTGQAWLTNGYFILATGERDWDIKTLVVKLPEGT